MYRLVLYYLIVVLIVALGLSTVRILPFSPVAILFSTLFILLVCYVSNKIFSYVFKAPTNTESFYITALILALIITPSVNIHAVPFLGFASVLAMSSKYILAIGKKHVFNPAAIAVALCAYGLGQSASWWVGTAWMMPVVIIGGILIVRKIQRVELVLSFFIVALLASFFTNTAGTALFEITKRVMLDSSLFFLGFVMLTEPLTTPPTKKGQIFYGVLTGLLFPPQMHIGSIYSTPELALLVGNVISYLISPKVKLLLLLSDKIKSTSDIIEFIFPLKKRFKFKPGQYMEWTLPHKGVDARGNRRYFTIASSPTEDALRLGVKFYENGSSFKRALQGLAEGSEIVAAQPAGEFTLPENKNQKLVFIAGGIGITPYRSIIKYLVDSNEKRDIIVMYSNKTASEIMYEDIFSAAEKLGIKTVYTLTDVDSIPENWKGKIGRIDSKMISDVIPDYMQRKFYLSGPHMMVNGFENTLREMNIPSKQIKIDFFPGFV